MGGVGVTIGIDLAAQDANTASCRMAWGSDGPRVEALTVGRSDAQLLEDAAGASAVGIDAPFGWPEPFFEAIAAHRTGGAWPGRGRDAEEYRRGLRLRTTDRAVHALTGLTPLSVSADRIAIAAFRCALLLDLLAAEQGETADRSGCDGRVAEVYPAAALRQWGLEPSSSYKVKDATDQRAEILEGLTAGLGMRPLPEPMRERAVAVDHALDALLCAVIARAVMLGRTLRPAGEEEVRLARIEGWIHLPEPDALQHLGRA
ncbi:unannotated protein [freshwater metagenome]|uniref:Unannotated protein n=1 Tax=freshwater metagenome TaxID=449393 RepID=A0A6J7DAY4_9ZZZZ